MLLQLLRQLLSFTASLIVFTFLFSSGVSADEHFDALVKEAMKKGQSLKAADHGVKASEAAVRRAWSRFLPSVNGNASVGKLYGDNPIENGSHNSNSNYDFRTYGVQATMPIFHGGQNYYGLKEAKANNEGDHHNYQHIEQQFALDIVRILLTVRRERAVLAKRKKNLSIVRRIVRSANHRYRAGEITKTDIAVARDQLDAAKQEVEQARSALQQAHEEYDRFLGRKANKIPLPMHILKRLPKSLNSATASALENNPEILTSLFRTDAAKASLRSSYGANLPQLDVVASYDDSKYESSASTSQEDDFRVSLRVSVPLINFENYANTSIKSHRHVQKAYEARDTRDRVRAMARIAWDSHKSAVTRVKIARSRVSEARRALYGMKREFDAGQRSLLDVLDLQERLNRVLITEEILVYEKYMSAYLLLATTGDLYKHMRGYDRHFAGGKLLHIDRTQEPLVNGKIVNPDKVRSSWRTNWNTRIMDDISRLGDRFRPTRKPAYTNSIKRPKKKPKISSYIFRSSDKKKGVAVKAKNRSWKPRVMSSKVTREHAHEELKALSSFFSEVTMSRVDRYKVARKISTPSFKSQTAVSPFVTGSVTPKINPTMVKPVRKPRAMPQITRQLIVPRPQFKKKSRLAKTADKGIKKTVPIGRRRNIDFFGDVGRAFKGLGRKVLPL